MAMSTNALAQSSPVEDTPIDDPDFYDEVVVEAERLGYSPTDNIIPEVVFGAGDVQALGVSDMGELLDAIAAETGTDSSEPPIILLNGRPVASRRDIRRFPSEAVRRVEVLPPEAALKFSSDPNRRVINFILRSRFKALTGNGRTRTTTDGGGDRHNFDTTHLRIRDKTRIALTAGFESQSALSQFERDVPDRNAGRFFAEPGNILSPDGTSEIDPNLSVLVGSPVTIVGLPDGALNTPLTLNDLIGGANLANIEDQRMFRDIVSAKDTLTLGAILFRPIGERLSVSGSLNADISESDSLRGRINTSLDIPATNPFSPFSRDVELFRADGPLIRTRSQQDYDANLSLFGDYARYRWALESSYSVETDRRDTDRRLDDDPLQDRLDMNDPSLNPFGPLSLSQISQSDRQEKVARLKGRLSGNLMTLPAGRLSGSIGFDLSDTVLNSEANFEGLQTDNNLSRAVQQMRAEINIPLSAGTGGRRSKGRASLRLSGSVEEAEDIGTLTSHGVGINWNPAQHWSLQGSVDYTERAPSLSRIGDPILIDPNVRVTDFAVGNNRVLIDRITGGNPNLRPEDRRDIQLTASYRPNRSLRVSTRFRSRLAKDSIESFPFLTPQVALAFPDRLIRDASGDLTALDARPVNAFKEERQSLRTGLNWFHRFGSTRRATPQTRSEERPPRQARPQQGRRSGQRGRRNANRVSLSLYHTWRLVDRIQFRETGPVFDLLDGGALRRLGGEPAHEIEARANLRYKNLGATLWLNHQSGSTIKAESLGATQGRGGDLIFDPLTTANLRLYYDLGRRANGRQVPRDNWRRGLRLTLDVNNVTNNRPSVSNSNGVTPFGYEADALDPFGRTIMLSLRKIITSPNRRRN